MAKWLIYCRKWRISKVKCLINSEVANICGKVAIKQCGLAIIGCKVVIKSKQVAINIEEVANKNCSDSY